MTPAALLTNMLAWSAQVALMVVVCAPLPRLLRLPAHVRYGFWRIVLVLSVALPFLQPWHRAFLPTPPPSFEHASAVNHIYLAHRPGAAHGVAWPTLLIAVLLAGIACRLGWLAIGWWRQRRMRAMSETAIADIDVETGELMSAIGARADVRWIHGLRQPTTFGLRRPLVLLPDSLRSQPAAIRRAVIAHELFHVLRRDSWMLLVEELIRAVTWFHPVMWWLISRVRLAREGVVDELTVMLTGARQTYLDALPQLADEAPFASSAFSRRRQLFYRVLLISGEVRMTSERFVAASAVLAVALVATGWTAVSAFPLQKTETPAAQNPTAPPPAPPRDVYRNPPPAPPPAPKVVWQSPDAATAIHVGAQVKPPAKVRDVRPVYPPDALLYHVGGVVIAEALVDRQGNVEEVHVLRSIPMLDQAAVDAVSQWKFTPVLLNGEPIPAIMTLTVTFKGQ